MSQTIKWNEDRENWTLTNYHIRKIDGMKEEVIQGAKLDTVITNLHPSSFNKMHLRYVEFFTNKELSETISQMEFSGESFKLYKIEQYNRYSIFFAFVILTLIGFSLSTSKFYGNIGANIGIGLLLSFSYIFLTHIMRNVAANDSLLPIVAVVLPNLIYFVIATFLLIRIPK